MRVEAGLSVPSSAQAVNSPWKLYHPKGQRWVLWGGGNHLTHKAQLHTQTGVPRSIKISLGKKCLNRLLGKMIVKTEQNRKLSKSALGQCLAQWALKYVNIERKKHPERETPSVLRAEGRQPRSAPAHLAEALAPLSSLRGGHCTKTGPLGARCCLCLKFM